MLAFTCGVHIFQTVDAHAIYDSGKQVKSTATALAFCDAAGAPNYLVPLLLDFHTEINFLYPLRLEFTSRFFWNTQLSLVKLLTEVIASFWLVLYLGG